MDAPTTPAKLLEKIQDCFPGFRAGQTVDLIMYQGKHKKPKTLKAVIQSPGRVLPYCKSLRDVATPNADHKLDFRIEDWFCLRVGEEVYNCIGMYPKGGGEPCFFYDEDTETKVSSVIFSGHAKVRDDGPLA